MLSRFLLCSFLAGSAVGHGLIKQPMSRNQRCGVEIKPHLKSGTDCELAFEHDWDGGYKFMSVLTHALGREVVRPLPTNVCGFDSETWDGGATPWDEPIDWPTSSMTAGTNEFIWDIQWGTHFDDTMDFKYWITKEEYVWELGKTLTWDDFEETAFCSIDFDFSNPGDVQMSGTLFIHNCDVPARSGRHIIYGEWGRTPATYERFHGCSDVIFGDSGSAPVPSTTPTPSGSTPATPTTPTPVSACTGTTLTAWQACTNSVECCGSGLACQGNEYYKQCVPSDDVAPATPTPSTPVTPTPSAPVTPTPVVSTPTPPTVPTTPTPSTSTCKEYDPCTNTPDCCPSGTQCYEYNQWYSQCIKA